MGQLVELRSKHVVLTGGAGFIGSHLCEALLDRDNTVTCVDNLVGTVGSTRNVAHVLDHPRFRLVTEDVLDWTERTDLTGVDCVFHLAASKNSVALGDPENDLTVNALGTLRLLLRAARDGVSKFVHASTGSVFGDTSREHVEDGPKQPVSVYGISKLAGESYCRVVGETFGLDFTVLRYYHVIGPRQDASAGGGVVPIFARRSLEGRPLTIYGSGAQTRSFTSVRDVVQATLLAATSDQMRQRVLQLRLGHQREHPGARRLRPRRDRERSRNRLCPGAPGRHPALCRRQHEAAAGSASSSRRTGARSCAR